MRLVSISIAGFRGFAEQADFDLSADVIILHGPNGVGKTSLLDAILWALTGEIARFSAANDPVSLYAREGIARVSLKLSVDDYEATIVRQFDGKSYGLKISLGVEEYEGSLAAEKLTQLLFPNVPLGSDGSTLSNLMTRAVYLQQDLVRQYIDSDTAAERFSLLSEVIGAGSVLDLQRSLEQSRNRWSRNSTAFVKEVVQPLRSRLHEISGLVHGLASEPDQNSIGLRDETHALFQAAVDLVGRTNLSTAEAPTSSSALDRFLRELAAERNRADRELSLIASLQADSEGLADIGGFDESKLPALEGQSASFSAALEDVDNQIARAVEAFDQERIRLNEQRNRARRLASLASLAIPDIDGPCPVCTQIHDVDNTRVHLQALIAASEEPESISTAGVGLAALQDRRTELISQQTANTAELDRQRMAVAEAARRRSVYESRVSDLGLDADEGTLKAQMAERNAKLVERMNGLGALIQAGERLSLNAVKLGEYRRREELLSERLTVETQLADLEKQAEQQDLTHVIAGRIIDGLREASLEVTRKQIEEIAPLFQRIYSRIDPHPTFKVTRILADMKGGKGQLHIGVADPERDSSAHNALPILSSSQLNSFAVSLFLALNLSIPAVRLKLTILDDPLQSLDSLNLLGLVDVLRRFREHRQIIVSTHEPRLLGLLQRKLRPVRAGERLVTFAFHSWDRQGPKVTPTFALPDQTEAVVLALNA